MTGAKGDVERGLTDAWQALGSAVDSFSDAEMEQPGAVEGWTAKDLLGHIAFWTQEAARNLQLIASGKGDEVVRPGSDAAVDEWNEREYQLRKDRPLAEVREEWLDSFQKAMQALADFPAAMLEAKVNEETALASLAVDTFEHYREHMAQLIEWRRAMETTEE